MNRALVIPIVAVILLILTSRMDKYNRRAVLSSIIAAILLVYSPVFTPLINQHFAAYAQGIDIPSLPDSTSGSGIRLILSGILSTILRIFIPGITSPDAQKLTDKSSQLIKRNYVANWGITSSDAQKLTDKSSQEYLNGLIIKETSPPPQHHQALIKKPFKQIHTSVPKSPKHKKLIIRILSQKLNARFYYYIR